MTYIQLPVPGLCCDLTGEPTGEARPWNDLQLVTENQPHFRLPGVRPNTLHCKRTRQTHVTIASVKKYSYYSKSAEA